VRRLLVTANVVPSLPILVTLMMDALSSSETSFLTRATRRNIPEDSIPQICISYSQYFLLWKVPCGNLLKEFVRVLILKLYRTVNRHVPTVLKSRSLKRFIANISDYFSYL
jgi:hypothetical protein